MTAAVTQRNLRILHLTTELPTDPGLSGGSTRQFRLLASLAAQGHDVTVVSPVTVQERHMDPRGALDAVGVRLIAVRRYARRELEALAGLRRRPFLALRATVIPYFALQTELLVEAMEAGIAEAAEAGRPDVVMIERDFSAGLGDNLPWDTPCVVTVQNVTAAYYASRASSSTWPRRAAYAVEAWRATRYITPRLSRCARLIAMSNEDAALLRARTSTPVDVLPNGTSTGAVLPSKTNRPTVLFTGTMSYPPNREGILWFHAAVWPSVRREIRDARLVVVGRLPDAAVLALADRDASVEVTGEVPDMARYFAEATVVVAPLHSGGGTRLKILDAFAARRAVVATTVGAEGLEAKDGTHLLIADGATEFAAATVQLFTNGPLRADIAAAGRRLAEERYEWASLGLRLNDILHHVVDQQEAALREPSAPTNGAPHRV